MSQLTEIATYARSRFASGFGCELRLVVNGKSRRLILIPSTVYSEGADYQLAIACEDFSLLIWDGREPLNAFDLVIGGFPLATAEAVVELVGEIFPDKAQPQKPTLMGQENRAQCLLQHT